MKTLIDFEGAGTLVANTKKLVTDAIAAHNSDSNSHGGASAIDLDTLTDTFVLQVAGKGLSTNDFTDADKTKLDNLPAISLFMKALLETNNAVEARSLLKVGREDIFDETGGRWDSLGACPDSSTKKFGTQSLHTPGSGYLIKPTGLTLGGKNFAIAFWAYAPATTSDGQGMMSFGIPSTMLQIFRDKNNKLAFNLEVNGNYTISPANADRTAFSTGVWHHVELDYQQSDNNFFFFLDGTLIYTATNSFFATAQTYPVYIGHTITDSADKFAGYIDEFLITAKLLHTANFSVPTSKYTLDSSTLALLHFD